MFHVKELKIWISQVKKVERQETKSRYFKLEIWSFFYIYGVYTFNFMHRLWASKYVGCLLLIFAKFYPRETNSGKSRSIWQLREQVSACSLPSQWSEKPMPWVFLSGREAYCFPHQNRSLSHQSKGSGFTRGWYDWVSSSFMFSARQRR